MKGQLRRYLVVLAAMAVAVSVLVVGNPQSASAAGWPVVARGATGSTVTVVQFLLRAHGHGVDADGAFGPATEGAVVSFQQARGYAADGIVGQQTWGGLIVSVSQGSTGDAVAAAQVALNAHGHGLAVDGVFGPGTAAAARAYQSGHGLVADGIVGPATWQSVVGGGSGGGGYSLPIPRGSLSRGYYDDPHHDYPAVDLPVGTGTQVYAIRSGTANQINNSRCGLGYALSGDDGATYYYCHLSGHGVGSGSRVGPGTLLGWSGSTGNSTGPHLHIEIVAGGNRCPQPFLLAIYDGGTPPAPSSLPTSGCYY
ncbi:peptidoglycan-binding protein [Phytomonospora sp. NPDC050363]|uniref:peptidoglycan-binding protein n=1 Tax=Phytomonospora sp. NPDC050363 TaxID=3155642 RepID=UPI0033EF6ACF